MTIDVTKQNFQRKAAAAKDDFTKKALPVFLSKYPELDQDLLGVIALDFFDIFCELNQVRQAAESHGREWSGRRFKEDLIYDTNEQWQYYAAFFYHKLTSDADIDAAYTPKQLDGLELRMNCPKHETMGLDHDRAVKVIGSLIKAAMETIKANNAVPIYTDNNIPEFNKNNPSVLETKNFPSK